MKLFQKRILIWVVLFFFLFGGLSFLVQSSKTPKTIDPFAEIMSKKPAFMLVDKNKPVNDQKVNVIIGSRRFFIPLVYIETPIEYLKEGGANLVILFPESTSPALMAKGAYAEADDKGKIIRLLVKKSSEKISPEEMLRARQRSKRVGPEQGFRYGLKKYASLPGVNSHETLIETDNRGQIVSIIFCAVHVPRPSCQHAFVDNNLAYKIFYDAINLPLWKDIQKSSIHFLNSYEVLQEKIHDDFDPNSNRYDLPPDF